MIQLRSSGRGNKGLVAVVLVPALPLLGLLIATSKGGEVLLLETDCRLVLPFRVYGARRPTVPAASAEMP